MWQEDKTSVCRQGKGRTGEGDGKVVWQAGQGGSGRKSRVGVAGRARLMWDLENQGGCGRQGKVGVAGRVGWVWQAGQAGSGRQGKVGVAGRARWVALLTVCGCGCLCTHQTECHPSL